MAGVILPLRRFTPRAWPRAGNRRVGAPGHVHDPNAGCAWESVRPSLRNLVGVDDRSPRSHAMAMDPGPAPVLVRLRMRAMASIRRIQHRVRAHRA
jgi:hypothetical protein